MAKVHIGIRKVFTKIKINIFEYGVFILQCVYVSMEINLFEVLYLHARQDKNCCFQKYNCTISWVACQFNKFTNKSIQTTSVEDGRAKSVLRKHGNKDINDEY